MYHDYFFARLDQARQLAASAPTDRDRQAHLKMAKHYEELIRAATGSIRRPYLAFDVAQDLCPHSAGASQAGM